MVMSTICSDGNGSLLHFNSKGVLVSLGVASTRTLFDQVVETMKSGQLSLEESLRLVTVNTANAIKLENKGAIKLGKGADLLVLKNDTFEIRHVFAMGQHMIENGNLLVKATFDSYTKGGAEMNRQATLL